MTNNILAFPQNSSAGQKPEQIKVGPAVKQPAARPIKKPADAAPGKSCSGELSPPPAVGGRQP
jgi:hypothetical protein